MTKSTIKTIVMVIAIILALTLAGGWIAQAVVSKNKEPVQAQVSENAKDGMQVELENGGSEIQLMSALIAVDDYDEYGVSALAETAYTLNATITPDNAPNKNLTWALSFANPSSSWAEGKTPSDYVTLTSSGTQATLSCIKAFGEPINVTATATADTSKSAQCKLNYKQKITDITFTLHNLIFYPVSGNFHYTNGLRLGECRVYPDFTETAPAKYTVEMTKSDTYTVAADALNVKFEMLPNDTYITSVQKKGYEDAELLGYTVTANSNCAGIVPNYFNKGWAQSIAGEPLTSELMNELVEVFGNSVVSAYTLKCYIGDMSTPAYTYPIILDFCDVMDGYSIDNVSFDKSEITF